MKKSAHDDSRASPPAEVKERKCYGSQPSELPKTLPAGTKGTSGTVLLAEATLRGGSYCFDSWRNSAGHETRGTPSSWGPHHVNWSTVEIQPAPTSAGEAVAAGWVPKVGALCSWVTESEDKHVSKIVALPRGNDSDFTVEYELGWLSPRI
ncbi:MAG TPA: hypothetical protein VGK73_01445, partial [Polyangiaceae bacterium]